VRGTAHHHRVEGARLDFSSWYAANWYNFHVLFNTVYDDVHGLKKLRLIVPFKLFRIGLITKGLLRALVHGRFSDAAAIWRGVSAARAALREERKKET
jgi:hypothetical protein